MSTFEEVKGIISDVLQLDDNRSRQLSDSTALIGGIPEFDSMAVVGIMTAIEDYYGIVIDDDEVGAETFETIGTLVSFVDNKIE